MGHDGPLVALQRLQCDVGDLGLRLPQEHLAGGRQHLFVLPLDFHLRAEEGGEGAVRVWSRGSRERRGGAAEGVGRGRRERLRKRTWAMPVTEMGTPWRV